MNFRGQSYDKIGANYSSFRKPDARIASAITEQLGDARTVLNIGAGTGSYEPKDRKVIAVEPSSVMISQRPKDSAPVIQAYAEKLPFDDDQFDVALASLTIHHWDNVVKGLTEMKRVSRRQLIFTWDPLNAGFWLTQDYFPEILLIDKATFPQLSLIETVIGGLYKQSIHIPEDCSDGFGCAYWSRPEAYLSQEVRFAISTFNKILNVQDGIAKLRKDIESGAWDANYGYLRNLKSLDLGYVLLSSIDL